MKKKQTSPVPVKDRVKKHYNLKKDQGLCTRFGCHRQAQTGFLKCKRCRDEENSKRRKRG